MGSPTLVPVHVLLAKLGADLETDVRPNVEGFVFNAVVDVIDRLANLSIVLEAAYQVHLPMPRPEPAHFIPAPLELPQGFIDVFRDGASWSYSLDGVLTYPRSTAGGRLVIERHGEQLLMRFDFYGSNVVTFTFAGVQ